MAIYPKIKNNQLGRNLVVLIMIR